MLKKSRNEMTMEELIEDSKQQDEIIEAQGSLLKSYADQIDLYKGKTIERIIYRDCNCGK